MLPTSIPSPTHVKSEATLAFPKIRITKYKQYAVPITKFLREKNPANLSIICLNFHGQEQNQLSESHIIDSLWSVLYQILIYKYILFIASCKRDA